MLSTSPKRAAMPMASESLDSVGVVLEAFILLSDGKGSGSAKHIGGAED